MFDMKACVQRFLGDARKVSLCAEIWTKKGLKSSYLGITAHVFSRYDHRRHQVTLAVRQIVQHPHNAETIREDVLTEWGIPLSKVLNILTDNGNNMVKAFHEQFCDGDKEEDEGLDESETIDFDKNKKHQKCNEM